MTISECVSPAAVEDLRAKVCNPTTQDFISREYSEATHTPDALSMIEHWPVRYDVAFRAVHLAVNQKIGDNNSYDGMHGSLSNFADAVTAVVSPNYEVLPGMPHPYGKSEMRWVRLYHSLKTKWGSGIEGTVIGPLETLHEAPMPTYDVMRAVILPSLDRRDNRSRHAFRDELYGQLRSPAGTYAVRKHPLLPQSARKFPSYRWLDVKVGDDLSVQVSEIQSSEDVPAEAVPEGVILEAAPILHNDAQMPLLPGSGWRRAIHRMRLSRGTLQASR